MVTWIAERTVGRLVEGRALELRTQADAVAYCDQFRRLIGALGVPAVICADYRSVAVFPDVVADELRKLMIDMNSRLLRSAILIAPDHATNALQVTRVVREAQNPDRRRFTSTETLLAWLGEVLTNEERARAEAFLREGA